MYISSFDRPRCIYSEKHLHGVLVDAALIAWFYPFQFYNYANNEWKDCIYIKIIGCCYAFFFVVVGYAFFPYFLFLYVRCLHSFYQCANVSTFLLHISYVNVYTNHNPFHFILFYKRRKREKHHIIPQRSNAHIHIASMLYNLHYFHSEYNMKFESSIEISTRICVCMCMI